MCPTNQGQTVTIRKLAWTSLRDAQTEMWIRRGRDGRPWSPLDEPEPVTDPVARYDAGIVLKRSVVAWRPPLELPAPGSELETWLAREILQLSNPKLFQVGDNATA